MPVAVSLIYLPQTAPRQPFFIFIFKFLILIIEDGQMKEMRKGKERKERKEKKKKNSRHEPLSITILKIILASTR